MANSGDKQKTAHEVLNANVKVGLWGLTNYTTPNLPQDIIDLLRSEAPIEREVREKLAEAFELGMKSSNDKGEEDQNKLYIRVHGHGGQSNFLRKAMTMRKNIADYDYYNELKATKPLGGAQKAIQRARGISVDQLRVLSKTHKGFEEWDKDAQQDIHLSKLSRGQRIRIFTNQVCFEQLPYTEGGVTKN